MIRRIAILAGDFGASLAISGGLAAYSRQHGPWRIELHSVSDDRIVTRLQRSGFAALVTVAPLERLPSLEGITVPIVTTLASLPNGRCPSVVIDDLALGDLAARHLMECGYRRFAFYGVGDTWSEERYRGFATLLARKGFNCTTNAIVHNRVMWPNWDRAQRERVAKAWLAGLKPPTAIFACDDLMSRVLADECGDCGLRVPDDIAILGVDNTESLCESSTISLSSIDPDLHRMGLEAGRIIDVILSGKQPPISPILIPPREVIQRRSTNAAAFDDPEVAAIVRYLQQNACDEITVDSACRHVAVSRRQMERRFLAAVGRPMGHEIRRLRIDRARELLVSTNLALADIAVRCGYEHLSSFSSAFREIVGITPSSYRQQNADR